MKKALAETAAYTENLFSSIFTDRIPGASVALSIGTTETANLNFGLATLAPKNTITKSTPFRVGSLTKQLTAALILQLVADKRMSLESSASDLLCSCSWLPWAVSIRHLLSHTSGVQVSPSDEQMKLWFRDSLAAIIKWVAEKTENVQPGQKWIYSDYNYIILGMIAEKIIGSPLEVVFQGRYFDRINLPCSHYRSALDRDTATARDYFYSSSGYYYPVRWTFLRPPLGDSALVTTAHEYSTWLNAYFQGEFFSKDLLSQAVTPVKLNNGDLAPFGFAWFISDYHGETILEHGGAIGGYRGHALVLPRSQLIIVILCNSVDHRPTPSYLAFKIAAHFLGKPHNVLNVHMSDSHRSYLEGNYLGTRGVLTLDNSAGRLLCRIDKGHCREIFWQGDATYVIENTLSSIEITSADKSSPRTLKMTHRFMPPDTYSRMG